VAGVTIAEMQKLEAGFAIVNDIRAITHTQWSRTLKAARGREAETAATLEQAEQMLDGGARSTGKPEHARRP
jgi:hypothetical protein